MVNCAVPSCNNGGNSDRTRRKKLGMRPLSLFRVPKTLSAQSPTLFQQWSDAISHNLKTTDQICELHFPASDIIKDDRIKLRDGTISILPRERYALHKNTVPSVEKRKEDEAEDIEYSLNAPNKMESSESDGPVDKKPTIGDRLFVVDNNQLVTSDQEVLIDDLAVPTKPETKEKVFTLDIVKEYLLTKPLPEGWCWISNSNSITFIHLDRKNYDRKLQLELANNLFFTVLSCEDQVIDLSEMCARDGKIIEVSKKATSIEDVHKYFRAVANLHQCAGTGIEETKYATNCTVFITIAEQYQRQRVDLRCKACRIFRLRLQTRVKKNPVHKNSQAQAKLRLCQKKLKRLTEKARKLVAEVNTAKNMCALIKADALRSQIAILPGIQQRITKNCFKSAEANDSQES